MPFPTFTGKDASNADVTFNTLPNAGQATKAGSLPVVLPSDADPMAITGEVEIKNDSGNPIPVTAGGYTKVARATFTRPADTIAYATGDAVSDSTSSTTPLEFTIARANGGTGMIRGLRAYKTVANLSNAYFRLHLLKSLPATRPVDNAVFSAAASGRAADHLGFIDFSFDQPFTDGASGRGRPADGEIVFECAGGSQKVYGLLEARGPYGGAGTSGEGFTIDLISAND